MPKRRLTLTILVLAVCLTGAVQNAKADDDNLDSFEYASPQEVVDGIASKFVRGVANVATGWLEFPKQIYLTTKEDGVAKGVFIGPAKGIGMTVVRTVVGVNDVATFLIPFPGFYDPVYQPIYVWQKE